MLFNSTRFLLFFAGVLLIAPRLSWRWQNRFLLAASYVFYGSWDWRFTGLLLLTTTVDYAVALRIASAGEPRRRRRWLLVSVVANLGVLAAFKYCGFFVASFAALLRGLGLAAHLPVLTVILPVGISFYTFQSLSYTLDVYRGRLEPTRRFLDFALFVSFFPQLVAGPIERARSLLPQVAAPRRRPTRAQAASALGLLLVGYFKKVAVADTLAPLVEAAFGDPAARSWGELAGGLYAFALQIYGDFSGYSDIARGVARLLGFELQQNFLAPYLSGSPAEFWRRWHVSLSSWIGDYLYLPLQGAVTRWVARWRLRSPAVEARLAYALAVVPAMLLVGLWHGAAWTFVAWGGLHGLLLAAQRGLAGGRRPGPPRALRGRAGRALWRAGAVLLTFHLVVLAWIPFRAHSFPVALAYLRGLCRAGGGAGFPWAVPFAGALLLLLDLGQQRWGGSDWLAAAPRPLRWAAAELLLVSVLAAAVHQAHTVTPFIYFQF